MRTEEGSNATRDLKGGQTLGLVRSRGEKWRINSFEHDQQIRPVRDGETVGSPSGAKRTHVAEYSWREDMPKEWTEMRFDSPDDAVAFVESELARSAALR